jgi:hypothetical protein
MRKYTTVHSGQKVIKMKARIGLWYDRDGAPLTDYTEIEKLLGDYDYKIVEKETVTHEGHDYHISTIWLGMNHNLSFVGDTPIIFETMIFGDNDGHENFGDNDEHENYLADAARRYSTEKQAKAGHKQVKKDLLEYFDSGCPICLEVPMTVNCNNANCDI